MGISAGSSSLDLVVLLLLLILSAVFSGTETAFFSLSVTDLANMRHGKNKSGHQVVELLNRAHDLLSALLIGNLLVNTAASVVATSICLKWFGSRGLLMAVPVVTLMLLLLGEITPKMMALRFRISVTQLTQRPLRVWLFLIGPVLKIIGVTMVGVLRLLPFEKTGSRPLTTEELQIACDLSVSDGALSETEGRSLARLLSLYVVEVAHIMTPRTEVITLRRTDSLAQLLSEARRAGYNRYPVLPEEGDRPEGLFHLKDLLTQTPGTELPLAGGLRELLFVPESKDVAALLTEMRSGGSHLAAVIDEHGDFTGIVTMADCLQALMGSVADAAEYDHEIFNLGDGRWLVDGRTDLRELREACGVHLPPHVHYVTVAGFMMAGLGRIPEPGDKLTLENVRMSVLEMTGHRIDQIQLTILTDGARAAAVNPAGGA
jgi:putative hemolysin